MAAVPSLSRSSGSGPVSGARASGSDAQTAGPYDLVRRLGSGAMGEVWLGEHRITGGIAAVKVLRPEVALRARVERFFARERRAIARLNHPHIVALHDLGPDYIATAYIDGSDLARRMQTPDAPGVAVRYAVQIASALAHAHARGVVHRDVKPSNILVDRIGNAYLADFGLASIRDDHDDGAHEGAGTPAYMAPEQARGNAGPLADQYGLARTLLDLLAGMPLASTGDLFAQLPPSLPRALVDTVRRAMAADPAARFATMAGFADTLLAIDLGDAAAPMRLALEQRVRAPFGWCTGPYETREITHEIRCAEFRLSDLEGAGLLPTAACAAFRARAPYEDMGWTMYAHEGRLGPIASDGTLARASDLVVILHGLLCSRQDWHDVAVSLCRSNAQAVVLVPDLFGGRDARFAPRAHADPRMTLAGQVDTVLAWLDLLSVRDLPTVLVGHSFSGAALLSATDAELGERVTRVAITPAFPSAATAATRTLFATVARLASLPGARRPLAQMMRAGPDWKNLSNESRGRFHQRFMAHPGWLLRRLAREYAGAVLAPAHDLRRCAVLVGDDDVIAPADVVVRQLVEHGLPRAFVQRVTGSGHYPQADNPVCPEARARNVADVARCVDMMLATSGEGAPLTTKFASTLLGADAATESATRTAPGAPSVASSAAGGRRSKQSNT